jgi:hypothetical protein
MAAATARGTSDACIVAWPSPLRAAVLSKRCDLGHRTKLSIESRGGATGGARLNRRSAPFGCSADNRQTTQTIPVAALAETEPARQALQGLAAETAFLIGVGVASGSILVEAYQRYRARVLEPVVGVVSDGLSAHVMRPIRSWGRRRWRRADPDTDGSDGETGRAG